MNPVLYKYKIAKLLLIAQKTVTNSAIKWSETGPFPSPRGGRVGPPYPNADAVMIHILAHITLHIVDLNLILFFFFFDRTSRLTSP